MSSSTIVEVLEYKDSLMKKAEELVIHDLPQKIVELNELLDTPMFNERNFDEVHQELNIPIPISVNNRAEESDGGDADQLSHNPGRGDASEVPGTHDVYLSSGSVPCNEALCEVIKTVKPIISTLVEDTKLLKMWISFMIPKVEDGNNFGVSIQEDTLGEILAVQSEATAFFNKISHYFLLRAKIISKVAKYPQIEDFRRAVVELDEKEYLRLWVVVSEVRNHYSTLHDIIIKNLEKLKNPRSSNVDNLY